MKNKSLMITIKEVPWKFSLLASSTYKKRHGDDSDAITIPSDHEVDFDKKHITLGNIIHELTHVYVDVSNTDSANLDKDQMEELCATINQEHLLDLLKHAHYIMSEFTKQEE